MNAQQIALVAAASLVGLYPLFAKLLASRGGVSYQQAMLSLATVRRRLLETGGVPQGAAEAIEAITHSLVETSDK